MFSVMSEINVWETETSKYCTETKCILKACARVASDTDRRNEQNQTCERQWI